MKDIRNLFKRTMKNLISLIKDKSPISGYLKNSREYLVRLGRDKICGRIIEYGLLGLIIFSPLPAASVHEWSILVIQLMVLIMMVAYFLMKEKPQNNEVLSLIMKRGRYLFLGLFVYLVFQITPLPKFFIKIFSPNAHNFKEMFSVEFSKIKFTSLSLIHWHSLREGLELLIYFFIGFLIVKTVISRQQILRLFYVIIGMGVFEALYGLFELYNKSPRIFLYKKVHSLDSVTGTFVNRNHFSGYLEMIIPLAIGLIIVRIGLFSFSGLKWRERLIRLSERGLSANLILSLGIIVMSLAIIFSKSRSGIFLLAFTFILFLGLITIAFEGSSYQKKWIKNFVRIIFISVLIISFYIGMGSSLERFSLDRLLQENRPIFWANTVGIFLDFPLFGTGLGTFASLYPDLRFEENPVQLYHAHNDYLEYLAELGIIGMILLSGCILFIIYYSFLIWRTRRNREAKGIALGGLVALVLILVHSITDFNLHIPANMMLFSVVLSLTIVTATFKFQRGIFKDDKKKKPQKRKSKKERALQASDLK